MTKLYWSKLLTDGLTAFKKDWKSYAVWALALLTLPYVLLYFLPNTELTYAILLLVLMLASFKFSLGVLIIGGRTLKKKKTSFTQFKKLMWQKFWPYVGTSVLVGLISLAIMLPFFIASSWISAAYGVEGTALAILLLFAGVLVVFFIVIRYLFATIIAVLGKKQYMQALQASKKIVQKKYWKNVLWAVGFGLVIGVPVAIITSIIGGLLTVTPTAVAIALTLNNILQAFLFIPFTLTLVAWYYKL